MSNKYLLTLPSEVAVRRADVRAMIVEAGTAIQAAELANQQDDNDIIWDDTMATSIELGAFNFLDWVFEIRISGALAGDPDIVATYTGLVTDNTVDEIMAGIVVALNATGVITTAAWDNITRTLLVQDGGTDALGLRQMQVFITPPGAVSGTIQQTTGAWVESITAGGLAAADDLIVQLPGARDYEDYVFTVTLSTGETATYTGGAGDTLDDVGEALKAALNALAINAADWDPVTMILTVAGVADGLGASILDVKVEDGSVDYIDYSSELVREIICGGIAASDVTVQFDEYISGEPARVIAKLA